VLLTVRFLDVGKFTTLTPLSLLISCKLSFPVVGLKISPQPTLALKSPNRILIWYFGNSLNTHCIGDWVAPGAGLDTLE
jgi:hypothetical protein